MSALLYPFASCVSAIKYLRACNVAPRGIEEKLKSQTLHRATNDKKLWRVMIAQIMRERGT